MSAGERESIKPAAFEPLNPEAAPTKTRIPLSRWLMFALIGVFLVALWFLLTARSLEITVVAEEEASINLTGLVLPFGDRFLLRSGSYPLRVVAVGYHPYESDVAVTKDATQRQEVILQPLPGRLAMESDPAGATLTVDGEVIGVTPLIDLPIEAGSRVLRLELPRYLPLEQTIEVTGRDIQQRLDLSLDPAWANVSVDSAPAGAELLIDGIPVGKTPATLEVLQGEHELVLELPGFAGEQRVLNIEPGVAQDLGSVVLIPATGVLSLRSTPSGANVSVDGEFAGQTPLELELEPNMDHRISLSRAGYRRASETLRMKAGSSLERMLNLTPLLGDVLVKVSPAEAELLVNGQPVGRGSQTLSLPAVLQRLEARLDGYESSKRSVTPRPGLEQLVEIQLLTPQAARKARLTPTITTALGQTLTLMNPLDSPRNEFSMGASRRDPGRRANEVLHPVRLERPFYFQNQEVTNAQFRQFQASHNSGQIEGNSLNREHQPVAQISWQQAASFCNWLSQREGLTPFYQEQQGIIIGFDPSALGYRLPTEAEWAWVARIRGDALQRFTWGDDFPPKNLAENIADNSSAYVTGRVLNGYNDGYVVSAPVGSFKANERGIFDLGGNVSEWIHDVYIIPASSGVVTTDPLGGQRGDNYVIRGASWALGRLPELRLSYRDYGQAGRDDVGFRIARYAE
ncbi:MAG: sulfatase activating formylglycine-generating enzyme [Glaciecola sp.]|jgi:formylglycine-generating enzyme required for sulfatase activity|uniref:PEGA domain-containing protein n=1 Tax=Congregibacter sp. TaxID=2744308 RepID=UPI0039E2C93A